jgi:Mg2+ and Co2+ transporter CorA
MLNVHTTHNAPTDYNEEEAKYYKASLGRINKHYAKLIKFINVKLDELTERLKEEEAREGILDKFGKTILSCAGCASRRASATSETSRQIQYYTKQLEEIQNTQNEEIAELLTELRNSSKGGTKNIKKRSKKYRKSNKRTQRRRVRKTKTHRARI